MGTSQSPDHASNVEPFLAYCDKRDDAQHHLHVQCGDLQNLENRRSLYALVGIQV
jgi:hypothetical protein